MSKQKMGSHKALETRRALGLSQAEFASLLGVHSMTVSKWERGEAVPSAHQVALIRHHERKARLVNRTLLLDTLHAKGPIAAASVLFKA